MTGGLGGVHRGAQQTFDISADLTELGGTAVAVVSAGVKSILDIGLTLETLETQGVPVLVHGSDEFPSFFSRSSGHAAPMRVDSAAEVAAVMRSAWSLGLRSGIVVANPIPAEDEIPADEIGAIIDQALGDMDRLGITGKDATPYLLGRIVEITDGASLTANIALVRNNARLGAAIAGEYAAAACRQVSRSVSSSGHVDPDVRAASLRPGRRRGLARPVAGVRRPARPRPGAPRRPGSGRRTWTTTCSPGTPT